MSSTLHKCLTLPPKPATTAANQLRFVEGDLICDNQQATRSIFAEVVRQVPFVQWSTLTTLLQEYFKKVSQHGKPAVREWYSWLDQEAYRRLREAVDSDRVTTRLGEFTAVLQFEPDEHYGYIDLSNIREWKFFHSRGFYFPGSENFAADGVGFEIWDRKLSELCFNKLGKLGWLRNSMYPEFWKEKVPAMDDCEYWQEGFSFSHQEKFEVRLGRGMEKLILTYYRKR